MFGNPHFDRIRKMFVDQFEPDGDGFLYRKSLKGAPVRVSFAERDDFITSFNRRLRYSTWSIFPATLVLIGLLVWLVPDADSAAAKVAMYVGIGLILIPFLGGYYWAWNAPSRELRGRSPEGAALSKEEVKRLKFSRMTYGQLGMAVVAGGALLWRVSDGTDIFHGWGVLWLVFAAFLIAMAVTQAVRKWLTEKS